MNASNRIIRPARSEDLESLIELGRRSWLSAFAQTAPFTLIAWWVRTDRTRTLYEEHWQEMLVLEEGGAIVGLVQPTGAEINGLWVRPDRQGTGVGTQLLRAGEDVIRQAGHESAWLLCSGWNVRALRFYELRHYVETGRESRLNAAGVEAEDIRMERPLGVSER
jgi:ribosomal protein S18 acetylase RimI-like enzyme